MYFVTLQMKRHSSDQVRIISASSRVEGGWIRGGWVGEEEAGRQTWRSRLRRPPSTVPQAPLRSQRLHPHESTQFRMDTWADSHLKAKRAYKVASSDKPPQKAEPACASQPRLSPPKGEKQKRGVDGGEEGRAGRQGLVASEVRQAGS